jgi:hypothetical protein
MSQYYTTCNLPLEKTSWNVLKILIKKFRKKRLAHNCYLNMKQSSSWSFASYFCLFQTQPCVRLKYNSPMSDHLTILGTLFQCVHGILRIKIKDILSYSNCSLTNFLPVTMYVYVDHIRYIHKSHPSIPCTLYIISERCSTHNMFPIAIYFYTLFLYLCSDIVFQKCEVFI